MSFRENPDRYIVFDLWHLKRLINFEAILFEDLTTGLFWLPGYEFSSKLWHSEATDKTNSEKRRYAAALKDTYLSANLRQADKEKRLAIPQHSNWVNFFSFLRRHHPELTFMELEPEGWVEKLGLPGGTAFGRFAEEYAGRVAV